MGERGTEMLQKESPEIAALPGQILFKSARPKSVGGFCLVFKNIHRSDIFLFPSLFLHCSVWLGCSAFLSAPNQCLQDSSLFSLYNSQLTGPGSVLGLAWLGGVTCGSLHGNSIPCSHCLSLTWF